MKIYNAVNKYGFIVKSISSFFYIGYLPFIPGTFGSLAGVGIFYLIRGNDLINIAFISALISLGLFICGKAEMAFNKKDASCIVIDEVAGMLLSLVFIPYNLKLIVLAFFLFRLLDTLKPYPAGIIQGLKGGVGVMGDDIVAGLYTNIILQIVIKAASFKAS